MAWIRGRPLIADALLAVLLAVVSLIALVFQSRSEHLPAPGPLAAAFVLLINLPLAWRRAYPLGVNLAIGVAAAAYGATALPDLVTPVPLSGVVAFYSIAAWCGRRTSMIVGVFTAISVVVITVLPATDSDLLDFSFVVLLLGSAWVLGDSARVRRLHTAGLEARAVWLARERDFEATRAVTAERARIARELHDVVAHHVSMMVIQAEAGPVAAEHDMPEAVRAFDTIAGTGRQALVEMRRLLSVLRKETDGPEPSLVPQPGVAQLPGLVERVRQTGLAATLHVEGEPVPLSAGVELSAYRIVQEALTNAVKHAGKVPVRVHVRYDRQDLRIEVRDDGPAARARPTGGDDGAPHGGNGHGLIGMRERAHLFGGELTAGPDPEGGFTVRARLPLGSTG
ncbi:sensor histidine kinase [Planotetraspora phitsanulokensis]|uniref:histidine kinase n=1 Tax=Planotetraspora phitsanulokensis TaxID=575192 RepID=A0A8J3XHC0_9ACTN|nr:two-component sensor histidine kinase [Planotetraspora phitsanulokensis]